VVCLIWVIPALLLAAPVPIVKIMTTIIIITAQSMTIVPKETSATTAIDGKKNKYSAAKQADEVYLIQAKTQLH